MMSKLKEIFQQKNVLFISVNIYILLLIILPKSFSTLGGFIPLRLFLSLLLIFIYVVDYFFNKNKYKKGPIFLTILYVLFLIFTVPSLFKSKAIIVSMYTILKFAVSYVIFYLFYIRKFEKQEYKIIINTFIGSTLVVILYGLFQNIFDFGLQKVGIDKYVPAVGRSVSTFFNTIYFGIYLNLTIPFIILNLYRSDRKDKKIFYSIFFILSFSLMLLTYTRSAFLIFIGILVLFVIFKIKMIFNKFMILNILICGLLVFFIPGSTKLATSAINDGFSIVFKIDILEKFLPQINNQNNSYNKDDNFGNKQQSNYDPTNDNNNDKTDTNTNDDVIFDDYSLEHRKEFADISNRIAINNKYTGVGFGAYIDYMQSSDFKKEYSDYNGDITHPHSSIVLLFSEVGIVAQIIFILFYILLLFSALKYTCINRNNQDLCSISTAVFIFIVGFVVVNIISENAVYDSQISSIFYVILGLSLGFLNKNSQNKKVLFISSTGGHLNELSQLKSMLKKHDFNIITEKTKSTLFLKKKYGNKVYYLMYGTKDKKFIYPFKLLLNCIKSLFLYFKMNPNYIITTGTHTAVPMCYIGKLFGSKIIFIETFANVKTKTLSGRIVYPIADLFIVQWEEMLKLYPKAIYNGYIY